MEQYREKLKMQNLIFGICGVVLGIFSLCAWLGQMGTIPFFVPTGGGSEWQSMWRGFASGVSFSFLALMLLGLVKNTRALRSEKELKKLYIKENDERKAKIVSHAQAAALQAFLLLGLVAVIISGYFSMTVSLTILACVFSTTAIALLFKLYYSIKF